MNQWLQLLEALHSSWIDELIERHPGTGPELGMPSRHLGWALPGREDLEIYGSPFHLSREEGCVFIATDSTVDVQSFWTSVLKRTERDFARRRIAPVFSSLERLEEAQSTRIRRLIWIPLSIRGKSVYLGIGVRHG